MVRWSAAVAIVLVLLLIPTAGQAVSPHKKASKVAERPTSPPRPVNTSLTFFQPGAVESDFGALFKAKTVTPKGEFETTEQYNRRIAEISGTEYYAVPIELTAKYDADHERYEALAITGSLQSETALATGCHGCSPVLVLKNSGKHLGEYVGTNAFGAKSVVTKESEIEDAVVLAHSDDKAGILTFTFSVPLERAKAVKMAFLVVFQPQPVEGIGITATAEGVSTPTRDEPYEIRKIDKYIFAGDAFLWGYDKTTGEVLGKIQIGRPALMAYPGAAIVLDRLKAIERGMPNGQLYSTPDSMDKVISYYEGRFRADKYNVRVSRPKDGVGIGTVTAENQDRKERIRAVVTNGGGNASTGIAIEETHIY
jgi:hypothetical protein